MQLQSLTPKIMSRHMHVLSPFQRESSVRVADFLESLKRRASTVGRHCQAHARGDRWIITFPAATATGPSGAPRSESSSTATTTVSSSGAPRSERQTKLRAFGLLPWLLFAAAAAAATADEPAATANETTAAAVHVRAGGLIIPLFPLLDQVSNRSGYMDAFRIPIGTGARITWKNRFR